MTTPTTTLITRDEILARAGAAGTRSTMEYGYGARALILWADGDVGYAKALRTATLLRFTRTTRKARAPMVAVDVAVAIDTGDLAGTLSFTSDRTLRGLVNASVFAKAAR